VDDAMNARTSRIMKHWRRAPEIAACVRDTLDFGTVILGYLGLKRPNYPLTVRFRTGERLRVETPHDLVTLWVIFFRREYQVPARSLAIVDAGANIGAFSLYAARQAQGATIYALEPFPSTRTRLEETLSENGLTQRVKVYPYGLGSAGGVRQMSDEGPSQSRGTTTAQPIGGVAVQVNSLEQFLTETGISSADLLKMDIEGAEHEVLLNATQDTLRRFRRIALEYHPNGSSDVLFEKLRSSGFTCTHDVRVGPDSGVAHFSSGLA